MSRCYRQTAVGKVVIVDVIGNIASGYRCANPQWSSSGRYLQVM